MANTRDERDGGEERAGVNMARQYSHAGRGREMTVGAPTARHYAAAFTERTRRAPPEEPVTISYTRPLEHSWERMKAVLFRKPFPIESWFVMGFGAWLAELLSGSNGTAGSQWTTGAQRWDALLGEVGDFRRRTR